MIAFDREPTGIEPPYEDVDPDALDLLVRSDGAEPVGDETTVTFEFDGRSVIVHGGGAVVVRPVESRSDGAREQVRRSTPVGVPSRSVAQQRSM